MKKLSAFLNTPARLVIAVGLIVLVAELLIMALIESFDDIILKDSFLEKLVVFLDPIALTAIVSPALYFLVFQPLKQQAERKHEELTLLKSEADVSRMLAEVSLHKLSQAVEQSPSSIVITDLDANIEYVNEAFIKETGYLLAEVVGQNQRILHSGKNTQANYDDMWAHLTRGEMWEGEFINRRKDGSEYTERELNSPIRADDGRITNYLAIKEDITERKRAEESLNNMATKFHAVFESSSDAIMLLGEQDFFDCNPATLRMFGCPTRDDFIRKHPAQRSPPTQPGGEDSVSLINQHIATAFKKGSHQFEWMYRRLDGDEFLADVLMTAMELDGKPVLQATVRDITERKLAQASEVRYRRLFESAKDGILILDAETGMVVDANPFITELLGYSLEDCLGKHIWDLRSLRNVAASKEKFLELQQQEYVRYEDIPLETAQGDTIPVEFVSNVYLVGNTKVIQCNIRDISRRKQAEAAVHKLNEELENKVVLRTADLAHARLDAEQANQAKSSFLASMSHEIRTPMNGVIGMLDVLQQSTLNDSQVKTVNIIHDSAFSLLAIIDDILDFSKIEAGKLSIELMPMSIADVAEGACETLDRMAKKKEVELTLFTDPAIPAAVMGDPGRLRQILINLANNAIKFSSGQGKLGKVSVRTLLVENSQAQNMPEQACLEPGRKVTLEFRVTDNGIGMDGQTLARLFTAFTQAETSTTRTYGGTGLGLAISRQLVNIMGGEITVQSEPGKGSSFIARLSFALQPEQPDVQKTDLQFADLPCLVIGDAASLAEDLAAYLAHVGALVERGSDLVVAQEWIGRQPPGLCIVVIDTAGSKPQLDELRAAARVRPSLDVHFVVIGRGYRRRCRSEAVDLVTLDGEVMHRRAFLEAVAVAAGRAKQHDWQVLSGDVKATLTPLSREEARRQGSLILVAEDNEINQKVILQQLTLLGKTADIANNGRKALELWQSGDYGILITDLHMPEMDGYELTAVIRAADTNKTRMPIIAFTANALKGEAEHCRAVGMDDYLSKPVQLVNLKAMLEKWLPVVNSVAVDVNVLKALVGDDEAIIRDFLHDFRLSAAKIAAELRAACAAGQAAAAGALTHKLKSSARSVGALALGELCAKMEQAGKAGDTATLAVLLPRFEQELASVEDFLEGY